jgi:FAD/FMN-containing dehydrogenase/Fe-S oxidoreductase
LKKRAGNLERISLMSSTDHPIHSHIDKFGLETELRKQIQGEVRFDDGSRVLYAVDSSNYRQVPIGVVIPKSIDEVVRTVAVCRRFGAPVMSRGGGTSLAGQCCNVAVVIDWTKYLQKILELNPQGRYARVQPGTICDQLRHAASAYDLTWGPDPATHTHCTFGGMLGNNSCGVHSQMAGKTDENVIEMEILLYDGTRMTVGWMNQMEMDREIAQGGRTGEIYARLKRLRDRYAELIKQNFPNLPRRVSGYNLNYLLPGSDGRFNVARALVGSESTCVTILEAKVQLVQSPPYRILVVLGYSDIYQAADDVPYIVSFRPTGLEGFDDVLTKNIARKKLAQNEHLSLLPEGSGWLLIEFGGYIQEEAVEAARRFMTDFQSNYTPAMHMYLDRDEQKKIWVIRESALGANSFSPGEAPNWEGWEDSAVAPETLGAYLRGMRDLYHKFGYKTGLYGHFGQGCVHCRIDFDLQSAAGITKWRAFMEEATDLVVSYGGSLSGEHGDGQARGEFLYKMFGPELIEAFREFKSIWDPDGKMNPGKIIDAYRIDKNLRLGADYRPAKPATHFAFLEDSGSLMQAAERCVGVGKCRRINGEGEQDTMCPSYMVTREEKHSTRGRAHLLWEMLHGDVIKDGWRNESVKEALDLCLACKGCKSDCPVNVDIATYKAEFLSHYWEGRLRPIQAYAFGWIDKWARTASIAPAIVNLFTQTPVLRDLAKFAGGVHQKRMIPAFAKQTFRSWFSNRGTHNAGNPEVLLWPDTFNNYFTPETAQAAVEVLEASGFQVEIPERQLCCGRPLYDHGFLAMAKTYLLRVLDDLQPQIDAGTPMVVLEPSCCSVFRDELQGLLPKLPSAQKLRASTFTLAEFLGKHAKQFQLPMLARKAIVQGHCHQKAIMRMTAEKNVLNKIELDYRMLESGCCGMAGAFGYEKEKYSLSIACGERSLLPEVRKAEPETLIIADGFSCREQIEQATGRPALHLAEVLQLALRNMSQP